MVNDSRVSISAGVESRPCDTARRQIPRRLCYDLVRHPDSTMIHLDPRLPPEDLASAHRKRRSSALGILAAVSLGMGLCLMLLA